MKKWTLVLGAPLLSATLSAGCIDTFEDDCTATGTCASGDGDGTGGSGDGDGDGDQSGGDAGASSGGGSGGSSEPCGEACTGETPVCDEDNDTCVGCLGDADCSEGVCDTNSQQCVKCLVDEDCADPSAPICNSGECVADCTTDDDCSHFESEKICDGASSGGCVECLPVDDDRASVADSCGANVCNPETLACDGTLTQAAKDICDSCIADSECLVGQNCIPLSYKPDGEPEVPLGGFCMKLFPGCSPPYSAGALNRVSLSGVAAADYCGLAEEFTTCAAIQDLKDGKLCGSDSDCGSGNGDGLCETVNGDLDDKCTYSCTASNQCVSGNDCGGIVGSEYCGG